MDSAGTRQRRGRRFQNEKDISVPPLWGCPGGESPWDPLGAVGPTIPYPGRMSVIPPPCFLWGLPLTPALTPHLLPQALPSTLGTPHKRWWYLGRKWGTHSTSHLIWGVLEGCQSKLHPSGKSKGDSQPPTQDRAVVKAVFLLRALCRSRGLAQELPAQWQGCARMTLRRSQTSCVDLDVPHLPHSTL